MTITRTRLGSLLAASALLVSLSACSTDSKAETPGGETTSAAAPDTTDTTEAPGDKATPTPTPLPEIEADTNTGRLQYCKNQKPFTGEAADRFGAEEVADAYCTFVTLTMEQSFIESYLRADSDEMTPQDFSVWRDYMTKDALDGWDANVAEAIAGDADAARNINTLVMFNVVNGSGYSFVESGPLVSNQKFSPASTRIDQVDGEDRLLLTFDVAADFNLTKDSADETPLLLNLSREITFALIQNPAATSPENDWLIDGFSGEFTYGEFVERGPLVGTPIEK
jgi:hypothetical protein